MLVLLPPSEGKTPAADGAPVDLSALVAPALTPHRARVLDALVAVSAQPAAATVLGVGSGLAGEVARNIGLRTQPAAPAEQIYSGVLYAAAGLGDLPAAARRRARGSVRIVSALWGLVAPGDRIPAYRLSMSTDLPGVGPLAPSWRHALSAELDPVAAEQLVVDCRSAPYVAAWRPQRAHADHWVSVRVQREQAGRRAVVSHMAKHTRGLLTRHLLTRPGRQPTTAAALLTAALEMTGQGVSAGGTVLGAELTRPGPTRPWLLDIITD